MTPGEWTLDSRWLSGQSHSLAFTVFTEGHTGHQCWQGCWEYTLPPSPMPSKGHPDRGPSPRACCGNVGLTSQIFCILSP